jgi:hypothetical protein
MTLSIIGECCYAVSFMQTVMCADCRKLSALCHIIMLNVIKLSVIVVNVMVPFFTFEA